MHGAATLVVAPAPDGGGDVDALQTCTGGPERQVNSIVWPNLESAATSPSTGSGRRR